MVKRKIIPGKWKHFKGGVHQVLGIGIHTETGERFAVYLHDGQIWIRPEKMFLEKIARDGKTFYRFQLAKEEK